METQALNEGLILVAELSDFDQNLQSAISSAKIMAKTDEEKAILMTLSIECRLAADGVCKTPINRLYRNIVTEHTFVA